MKREKRYFSFGYKLMISYIFLLVLPVVFVGIFAYNTSVHSITEQTSANIHGTLQQIQDNINYKTEDIMRLTDRLYYDRTLADYLRRYDDGYYSYETTKSYLLPSLQSTIHSTKHNIALSVYIKNDTIPEVFFLYDGMDPLRKGPFYEMYHLQRIVDKEWYTSFPKEEYGLTTQWSQIESDKQFQNISLLRRLMDAFEPTDPKMIGFIKITVKISDILQSVDYQKIRKGSTLYIENELHEVIYISSDDPNITAEHIHSLDNQDFLQIKQPIPSLNWTLVANIPNHELKKELFNVKIVTLLLCIISIVVFSMAGVFLSAYFSKRVTKIVSVLSSFQEGDFHKRLRYKGHDEFNQIASALNDMGENMNQLIQDVYLSNLQKKEAELESLQAQINPHFLYNTLSSINRLAQFGETEKHREMVSGLAKFYRLSLNDGLTIISIEKELQQVQAYIDIKKIQYESRMNFSYDIDEEVLKYDTVKLILQPFVENILEHAWYADRIHIRIVATAEPSGITFKIIDDGMGMNIETIDQIFNKKGIKIGYGIRNVDQRIKLQFGEAFGVSLHSRLGIGTTAKLTIPYYIHS